MSTLPPLSIVCPNVSSNSLGRALLLADLLRTETRVQVAGMRQAEAVWAPAASAAVPIRAFPLRPGRSHYFDGVRWLQEVVGDDFVIVSKPVLQSLGLALLGRVGRRGMIVDIDDWQTGFFQYDQAREGMSPAGQRLARFRSYTRRGGLNGFVLTRLLEAYARRKPYRTVSNRWLRARFGGELLYHVRDPAVLDPSLPSRFGIDPLPRDLTWVGFVGTPRAHKGLRILVDAVVCARRSANVGLVLMGVDDVRDAAITHARRALDPDTLRIIAPFPLEALRDHLNLADILAIPSLEVPGSWGQIPAKLFDAMSMAKPIVASQVNDIPEVLGDSGVCVPPGD